MSKKEPVLLLAYAGCQTCRTAIRWLNERGIEVTVRPIVDQPPMLNELAEWIPSSGLSIRKWLNTSGQSYRSAGKETVDAATDDELMWWLAKDGKLVKRPVLVKGDKVLVGFKPEAYEALFGST